MARTNSSLPPWGKTVEEWLRSRDYEDQFENFGFASIDSGHFDIRDVDTALQVFGSLYEEAMGLAHQGHRFSLNVPLEDKWHFIDEKSLAEEGIDLENHFFPIFRVEPIEWFSESERGDSQDQRFLYCSEDLTQFKQTDLKASYFVMKETYDEPELPPYRRFMEFSFRELAE